jgi:hypothetical protein
MGCKRLYAIAPPRAYGGPQCLIPKEHHPAAACWPNGTAALLTGAAIATAAHAAPVASPGGAGDDAELIGLVNVMVREQAVLEAIEAEPDLPGDDQDIRTGVALDGYWNAADRVIDLEATTAAGRIAKARAMELTLIRCVCTRLGETLDDIGEHEFEHRMALSLARDVLAGRAAA